MKRLQETWNKYRQFIAFCVVGAGNTVITQLVYMGLYNLAGMNTTLSSILGYGAGVLNGYLWSTLWVFRVKRDAGNFLKFVVVNLVVLGLNTLMVYLLTENPGFLPLRLHQWAQIMVTPVTLVANFLLNRIWTFRESNRAAREAPKPR
jgi:putative flippase GtrA